jgi:minor histocompatibility antigen H13
VLGRKTWNSLPKYKLLLLQGHRGKPARPSRVELLITVIPELFNLPIPLLSVLLLPFSTLPSIFYSLNSKSALFTNILALSFSHTTMGLLKLDGFKTGTILLAGLFFYDIWWVFGTEVVCRPSLRLCASPANPRILRCSKLRLVWMPRLRFSGPNLLHFPRRMDLLCLV